ncbi:MAG: hypothetical protein NT069_26925 [Planctomycetota bacterium]|nr:hypothetical protein [Planctomycetota bacterium]
MRPDPRGACRGQWGIASLLLATVVGCSPAVDSTPERVNRDPIAQCASADGETPYEIAITGSEDRWQVRYPGMEQPLVTTGDAMTGLQLHVPVARPIVLILNSTDYVYTLELPDWKIKEIAVPKLEFRMEFRADDTGRFELVGDHLCRAEVQELRGTLVVESPSELIRWLRERPSPTAPRGE